MLIVSLTVGLIVSAGIELVAALVIAFFVVLFTTAAVYTIAKKSIESGNPSWLMRGMFGALVAAYAFLLWFCFFGGWRALA